MLNLLWTVILGFATGAVAKLIMPGKDPGGFLITVALGVAGALLSTYLGRMIGWYQPGQLASFLAAVVGAIILLAIYRLVRKKRILS